ncbi:hypothetical protein ACFP7A_14305 [Sporolactobacillus kofuensis]|uniref:Fur-regulated basic protein FbpA n=1 Tax=Sporolactobacillus kofuensis TaxID=269672 RepID=A0ABW1WGS6_9BACL|nr:hypothetical protein [Sporolactobacillus kofuensis]MCO7177200.1 hypothetical protein [Sporolactobacillus kofuensis]
MSEHKDKSTSYRRTMENRFIESGYIRRLLKEDGIEVPDTRKADIERIKAEIKKYYPDYEFPQEEKKDTHC